MSRVAATGSARGLDRLDRRAGGTAGRSGGVARLCTALDTFDTLGTFGRPGKGRSASVIVPRGMNRVVAVRVGRCDTGAACRLPATDTDPTRSVKRHDDVERPPTAARWARAPNSSDHRLVPAPGRITRSDRGSARVGPADSADWFCRPGRTLSTGAAGSRVLRAGTGDHASPFVARTNAYRIGGPAPGGHSPTAGGTDIGVGQASAVIIVITDPTEFSN
jgi:hypothetical protein